MNTAANCVLCSLAEGGWAGGSILTLTGTGLLPAGGSEAVLVILGEEGRQKSCSILSVNYTAISCVVPDYSDLQGADTDLTVPVTLEMGYQVSGK